MKVAFVTESFLPVVNGVTNSVLRSIEHLRDLGHQTLVVAPGPGEDHYGPTPVVRTSSHTIRLYPSFPIGVSGVKVHAALRRFRPDVVHLASPIVLGATGLVAARRLDIPTVAVFQTDVAGFATHYRQSWARPLIWSWLRWIHNRADLTLAPSTMIQWELGRRGFERVERWGRGVDLQRFHPRRRSPLLHRRYAPNGEVLVGYVGRLGAEKQVHLLRHLDRIPGTRLVVVGDGPELRRLQRRLRDAVFTGFLQGDELAAAYATLDLFVHTGVDETFCQTVQEALASGVPALVPAAGGPVDLVHHGENGWLFPPDNPGMIRAIVGGIAADRERLAAVRAAARPSVADRSWAELVGRLIGHYETVARPQPAREAA